MSEIPMTEIPYCEDCKWHRTGECFAPPLMGAYALVSRKPNWSQYSCVQARGEWDLCGWEAKHWEAK